MRNKANFFIGAAMAIFITALLSSCSTVNEDSPLRFIDPSGNHPDGWVETHRQYAQPDGSPCMDCHGDDLAGGISGVSCSTDSFGGQSCHASGPAFHPADWVSTHSEFARPDGTPCFECHGVDLLGGISGVSCSSDSFNGQSCHGNGPAFHPTDWLDSSLTGNDWHGDAYDNFFQINGLECADCHDTATTWPGDGDCVVCHFSPTGARSPGGWAHADTGTAHAAFAGSPEQAVCVVCHDVNISFGNQESCHNCHGVAPHDVEYLDHDLDVPDQSGFDTQCSSCHAITGISPDTGAPECDACHINGSPYTQTNCGSCHGNPPGSGEHGEHISASCDECHLNAGSGTGLNHFYDGEVDVQFIQSVTYVGGECSGTCHIGSESDDHNNRNW